jgi:hypothetical protein
LHHPLQIDPIDDEQNLMMCDLKKTPDPLKWVQHYAGGGLQFRTLY